MSSGFVSPGSIVADQASDDGVVFYGVGFCAASACCPDSMPVDDVLDAANRAVAYGPRLGLDDLHQRDVLRRPAEPVPVRADARTSPQVARMLTSGPSSVAPESREPAA